MEIGQYEMNSGERVITQDDGKLDIKYLIIYLFRIYSSNIDDLNLR